MDKPEFPREYFVARLDDCDPLPLLDRVCRDPDGAVDCAVLRGMYRPISNDLKRCDPELQIRYSRTWWCHNHGNRACRGNALVLGRKVVRAMEALDADDATKIAQHGGERREGE